VAFRSTSTISNWAAAGAARKSIPTRAAMQYDLPFVLILISS